MRSDGLSRGKRIVFSLIATVGVPLLVLVIIEGGSSLLLFGKDLANVLRRSQPGRSWTTFDPRVGSVAKPNVYIRDMWGPGVYLRTNMQGFRDNDDVAPYIREGRLRIICSGDSYTMGQGVSNDDAWCQQLTAMDPRLETVNMGQAGYGFDNAYLRYRHYGRKLQHGVHVFAFVTDDLYRMRGSWSWSWQRPKLLQVRDDALVVPDRIECLPCRHRWTLPFIVGVGKLRTVELLDRLGRRLGLGHAVNRDSVVGELAAYVIKDLAAMASAQNGSLVLLHLPTFSDYGNDNSRKWRERLRANAASDNLVYIDLIEDFHRLPQDSLGGFFLPAHVDPGRHYTGAGHAWVAERLYEHLLGTPELTRHILALETRGVETGSR